MNDCFRLGAGTSNLKGGLACQSGVVGRLILPTRKDIRRTEKVTKPNGMTLDTVQVPDQAKTVDRMTALLVDIPQCRRDPSKVRGFWEGDIFPAQDVLFPFFYNLYEDKTSRSHKKQ